MQPLVPCILLAATGWAGIAASAQAQPVRASLAVTAIVSPRCIISASSSLARTDRGGESVVIQCTRETGWTRVPATGERLAGAAVFRRAALAPGAEETVFVTISF